MTEADDKLREDLAFYERGGLPSPEDLEKAPRIDLWRVVVQPHGDQHVMRVTGIVSRRPNMAPVSEIETAPVRWVDRGFLFVRTRNTLYELGEPAEEPAVPV